ncbi:MAG: hypothetical protein LBU09_05125 [Endomicrobium sp.]|jgi:hypothetical protein|nr:hypothetical protein [Endomicrobium sp.]
MKKFFLSKIVLAAAAAAFMSSAAFAEFNLRTSVDIAGDYEQGDNYRTFDVETSATLSGDYLRGIGGLGKYLKIGGGFEILAPKFYKHNSTGWDDPFWFLPLYISIQTNPVPPVPELFFRLNLGYNLFFIDTNFDASGWAETYKGGLYYSFVTGWEFPFGLFFDITYAFYNGTITQERAFYSTRESDYLYSRLGVGIGYKFGRVRNY